MPQSPPLTGLTLDPDVLSAVDPFHIALDDQLRILSIGRTLKKLVTDDMAIGSLFFEMFEVMVPRAGVFSGTLESAIGKRIEVKVLPALAQNGEALELRGSLNKATLNGERPGYYLSFNLGRNITHVIDTFALTESDFAIADFSMDMVAVMQLQTAMLSDSTEMAERLDSARQDAEDRLRLDHTTGLLNRLGLMEYLQALKSQQHSDQETVLLHIDLDRFKQLNDAFGHAAGDAMLVRTAQLMKDFVSEKDACARIGGDEFVIVLSQINDQRVVISRAADLIKEISKPVNYASAVITVGASIGLRHLKGSEDWTPEALLLDADIALYAAKRQGRARVQLFSADMRSEHKRTLNTIDEIRKGLENDEFEAYFQPQIDVQSNMVLGFEALARWHHPTRGVLAPGEFLDAAQHAGLVGQIDAAVRDHALKHFARWNRLGLAVGQLCLNVPQSDLVQDDFVGRILDILTATRLTPDKVCLELMEHVLLDNKDEAVLTRLELLSSLGFKFALDDFGTGHTSIVSLIDAPISLLKLDRSFVTNIESQDRLQKLTRTILLMAGEMGIPVLAEGIETAQERQTLEDMGCHAFQGYLLSRPLSPKDALTFMVDFDAKAFAAAG